MRRCILQVRLRNNPFLAGSWAFDVVAHLCVLHLRFMQPGTTMLALEHWLLVAVSIIVLVEVEKLFLRRRGRQLQNSGANLNVRK